MYPQPAYPGQQDDIPLYQPTQPAKGLVLGPVGKKARRPRRRRGCMIGCLSSLGIFLILGIFLFITAQRVLAFGSAISNQSPLSTQTSYMGGSQRVNFLIMGYGGSGHDGAYLTDSLVIISLMPQSHHTTLISVPRDLWVQNPPNSGNYSKINAVYTVASKNNADPIAGGNAVAQKISLVTGLQVNYWMTINFTGFRDFIDAIGGIDVDVPDAFTAKYPANDDPAVNPNWITVKFTRGLQHMNGQRAIIYARARYVLDNPAEGSDFARSQRQQLIMKAALTKMKQWQTWPHMYGALDKLEHTLYSNLSLADLAEFALKMDLNTAHRVGLSNANVLVDATSDDGQSILLPQNNNWALIPAYIQKQLYQ
jgi:LCP family protein required for cell wall assembly